jgi:DNA polymerase
MKSYEELRNQIVNCTKCDLCKTRKNAVPGKGNLKSEIMFVGEAPGRSEDSVGEPFVGAAGKRLSAALEKAGVSRESVYITNVVKCRPPNNRVPTLEEKRSCEKYLESEIELTKPKVICIMGNTAYHSILGGNNITKERGKFIKKDDKWYFLTIHPAAVIYNQELLDLFEKDIKELVIGIKNL